jgi:hypothetical protein
MPHVRLKTDAQTVAQVRRQLKAITPALDKKLVGALKQAADVVVVEARVRMIRDLASAQRVRPRRVTGRAAASIKAGVAGGKVYVRGGGTKATAYYGWLDYGGRLKSTGILRPSRVNTQDRPVKKDGRYIYPAIREKRHIARRNVRDALERTITEVGLNQ